MKIGIFADSHYSSYELTCKFRRNNQSLKKIKEAYDYFVSQNCEMVICLGDLIDYERSSAEVLENLKEIAKLVASYSVKTVAIMGNHDAFTISVDDFYSILKGCEPEDIMVDGKNLLFLDNCHHKDGTHYTTKGGDYRDTYYPFADELKNKLDTLSGDTYIFMHQPIDPLPWTDYKEHEERLKVCECGPEFWDECSVVNAQEISDIVEKSGKVKAVYQGHFHFGKREEHNGVKYITVPSMAEYDNEVGKSLLVVEI